MEKSIVSLLIQVFGTLSEGKKWLGLPNSELDGSRPIDLIHTNRSAVTDLLERYLPENVESNPYRTNAMPKTWKKTINDVVSHLLNLPLNSWNPVLGSNNSYNYRTENDNRFKITPSGGLLFNGTRITTRYYEDFYEKVREAHKVLVRETAEKEAIQSIFGSQGEDNES